MNRRLTMARLILAIVSTGFEEAAIWAVWRFVLPDLGIQLSRLPLIVVMVAWACFSVWLFIFTTRTLQKQSHVGLPSMVGTVGVVTSALRPEGLVKIRSETWGAVVSEGDEIGAGVKVVVVGEDGLKLSVREIDDPTAKR